MDTQTHNITDTTDHPTHWLPTLAAAGSGIVCLLSWKKSASWRKIMDYVKPFVGRSFVMKVTKTVHFTVNFRNLLNCLQLHNNECCIFRGKTSAHRLTMWGAYTIRTWPVNWRELKYWNVKNLLNVNSAFSALTLLVWQQEGHPACKNWVVRYWCGYLEQGANGLHIVQLMPHPPHHLLLHWSPESFTFVLSWKKAVKWMWWCSNWMSLTMHSN